MLRHFLFATLLGVLCQNAPGQDTSELTNSIGMKLKLIPSGSFVMGSSNNQPRRGDDESQFQVTLTQEFYLGVFEVTQADYEKVMGSNNSFFQKEVIRNEDSSRYPVEQVSWEEAAEFCKKLSDMEAEKKNGRLYRLPTEAEWEYACRAGSKTAYHFGESADRIADFAWIRANSEGKTHPVGGKKPNVWGLYDMTGNAWEWCQDEYGEYPLGSIQDPQGAKEGEYHVLRGGSWYHDATFCRSASRYHAIPSDRHNFGFRVAMTVVKAK